jgi:hypothetical protein
MRQSSLILKSCHFSKTLSIGPITGLAWKFEKLITSINKVLTHKLVVPDRQKLSLV